MIFSVGMKKNSFDVAPNHGRTPFYVDEVHPGDNIDDQNYRLNELTGLYYLWRNEHNVGYKGLEHYRRALFDSTYSHLLEPNEIETILQTHDVILTDNYVHFPGPMTNYCLTRDCGLGHIERMNEKWGGFGDFYWDFICTHTASEMSWCNMFIAREEVADEYCDMCFDLCFNLKQPEDKTRFFGFCTEKLWTPWAAFKKLSIYCGKICVYSPKPLDSVY